MKKEDIYILVGFIGILQTVLFLGFCFTLMSVFDFYSEQPAIYTSVISFLGFGLMAGYGFFKKYHIDRFFK
jgi:hypothetical protein